MTSSVWDAGSEGYFPLDMVINRQIQRKYRRKAKLSRPLRAWTQPVKAVYDDEFVEVTA